MNCKPHTEQSQDKAVQLAVRILQYSRNELLVALRFMDMALCKLEYQAADVQSIASDGQRLYFQPHYVFQIYEAAGLRTDFAAPQGINGAAKGIRQVDGREALQGL